MKPESVLVWLMPTALVSAFIAYLFLSTPSEMVLCRQNADCFREWVSALSGWVAAAAAFVTVSRIQHQIAEANRHQQENIEVSLGPDFVLARRIRRECVSQSNILVTTKTMDVHAPFVGKQMAIYIRAGEYEDAIRKFTASGDLATFEEKVGDGASTLRQGVESILNMLHIARIERDQLDFLGHQNPDYARMMVDYDNRFLSLVASLAEAHAMYVVSIDRSARDFLLKWRQETFPPLPNPLLS